MVEMLCATEVTVTNPSLFAVNDLVHVRIVVCVLSYPTQNDFFFPFFSGSYLEAPEAVQFYAIVTH